LKWIRKDIFSLALALLEFLQYFNYFSGHGDIVCRGLLRHAHASVGMAPGIKVVVGVGL